MKEEDAKYPYIVSNTEWSDRNGMHWQSILDLHPNKEFFYLTALVFKV